MSLKLIGIVARFFYQILFQKEECLLDKEEQEFWKNRVFYIISVSFLIGGFLPFLLGTYMFYKEGLLLYASIELLFYFFITFIITRNRLSVLFRKLFFTLAIYLLSLFLLITTGSQGAGMVCICFSLLLAGCLLNNNQLKIVILFNFFIFMVLTLLLNKGCFDTTNFVTYKSTWNVVALTTQLAGIILVILTNTIYIGLERQTQLVKKSNEVQRASEIKLKAMIANNSDVILIVNEKGCITYHSPNLMKIFEGISDDILNQQFEDVFPIENINEIYNELHNLTNQEGMTRTMEVKYSRIGNEFGYAELSATFFGTEPHISGILINFHDVTERKKKEEEIEYLSYHDSLTGLYNRIYYEKKKKDLDTEIYYPLSIIVGDINGLKLINDALGHIEGDKLLRTIGGILKSTCRKEDVIARLGGDEFNVLLPRTSHEVASQLVENIYLACDEYNQNINNELHWISISLGTATKKSKNESFNLIDKTAEDSMYRRKLLESKSLHSSIISSMRTVLFEKSQETEEHAQRLKVLTREIGYEVGLTKEQFDELDLFSTLHDIGKIGIEDHILNKPGKLTDDEWVIMKKHTEIGYRIAMASPDLIPIADYILTHHERWDGLGYPQGLKAEEIPLLSRILAVADAYDAMVEDRPYRKGMTHQAAIGEIKRNLGTQFDPVIGTIFITIIE